MTTALDELKHFEAFAKLDSACLALLAEGLIRKAPASTATVLYKGQQVSGAYVVLAGRLRVYTMTPGGTEATLYFVEPGDTCVLALNCLFNDLLYPAWVEADAATRIAIIPGQVYRELFDAAPSVRDLTVRTLSTLVWRLMGELEQLHSCTQRQRLANFIVAHATAEGELRMTQQQLASHLGSTREGIARLMSELVNEGLLRTGRGRLWVQDAQRLAQLSHD